MIILIIILIVSFIVYRTWYHSAGQYDSAGQYNFAEQKGKRGEMRMSSILSQLPDEYTVLNDLVYQTERGTTQIDHIVVSKYGIFAIETKNYSGEIYGDDERQKWTQMIVTDVTYAKKWWKTYTYATKNRFYNPVKQSLGHTFRIKELLSAFPHVKIVPMVVFTGEAILKNVESRYPVIYEEHLLEVISEYRKACLRDDEVQKILDILEWNNVRKVVSDSQHVENLRTAAREAYATINSGICPKCGGHLVERHGRYGAFYGCSNYPKCRFTT